MVENVLRASPYGRWASSQRLLEPVEAPLHDVAALVRLGVDTAGRPSRLPLPSRLAAWSFFSGLTRVMRRLRRTVAGGRAVVGLVRQDLLRTLAWPARPVGLWG